ncbi:MAG: glycosyltransferase [Cyclobacteriaceae bacterium]|nr:glycosyltransferase [Cyclobacteriaceae bacterium]
MKVLHVIEPFASGITTFLVYLTKHLPQHDHIILHGTRTSVDNIVNVRQRFDKTVSFIEWPGAQREISLVRDLKALFQLVRVIRQVPCEIIHLHSSKAGFLGAIACLVLRKKNVVYTPHAVSFLRTDISVRKRKLFQSLEKIASKINPRIIACCKQEWLAYKKLGIETTQINNGFPSYDIEKYSNSRVNIVFSGLITRQKDPETFNLIAKAFVENSEISFTWIGDGELRDQLSSTNIRVTGWIEKPEINKLLGSADIYLATSSWEGLPYGVLEAMNSRCSLVLSKAGGHIDLVKIGVNGYLFDSTQEAIDQIAGLIGDRKKIDAMGISSYSILRQKFSIDQMTESYHNYYSRIIKK